LSQLLPGANIVNMALIVGDRAFGLRGAIAALAGMMTIPLVLMLSLVAIYNQFADLPAVAGALRGMAAVAAGLTIGMSLKLVASLRNNPLGPVACIAIALATFLLIAVVRAPLAW